MKRWKKNPQTTSCIYSWKVVLICVQVPLFILGILQAWRLINFHSPRLNSALLGCLGQVCKCGKSCCTCRRAKASRQQSIAGMILQHRKNEQGVTNRSELPCAKALAFLNAHLWMYTASEKLASPRHFIKDMCETEYVKHKCVNHLKGLWTSPTLTTWEASFERRARYLYGPLQPVTTLTNTPCQGKHALL